MPVGVMGQASVILNGRSYRFNCEDGEEARLKELAAYVKGRVDALTREFGNVGEERLVLMAAILITAELWDARATNEKAGVTSRGKDADAAVKDAQRSGRVDLARRPRTASGDA